MYFALARVLISKAVYQTSTKIPSTSEEEEEEAFWILCTCLIF